MKKESIKQSFNFFQEVDKQGWKSCNSLIGCSNSDIEEQMKDIVGKIEYEGQEVCNACMIYPNCLLSVIGMRLKFKPEQMTFKLSNKQFQIKEYSQIEQQGFMVTAFKLKSIEPLFVGFVGMAYGECADFKKRLFVPSHPQLNFFDQNKILENAQKQEIILQIQQPEKMEAKKYFQGLPLLSCLKNEGVIVVALIYKQTSNSLHSLSINEEILDFVKCFLIDEPQSNNLQQILLNEKASTYTSKFIGKETQSMSGEKAHKDGIYSLCLLNEENFASCSVDKSIRVWDTKQIQLKNNLDCDGCCRFFSCENELLAGTSENHVISINWIRKQIESITLCKNKLYSVLILSDLNKKIVAGDWSGHINVIENGVVTSVFPAHSGSINVMMKSSLNKNVFFTGGEKGEIKIWDLKTMEVKGEFVGHDKAKSVYFLECMEKFLPNSEKTSNSQPAIFLVSGGSDKTLRLWNVSNYYQLRVIQLQSPLYAACIFKGSLCAIGDGENIKLIDLHHPQNCSFIDQKFHKGRVNAICRLSSSDLVTGDIDGKIIQWSIPEPQREYAASKQAQDNQIKEQQQVVSSNWIDNQIHHIIEENRKKSQLQYQETVEKKKKILGIIGIDHSNRELPPTPPEILSQQPINDKSPAAYRSNQQKNNYFKRPSALEQQTLNSNFPNQEDGSQNVEQNVNKSSDEKNLQIKQQSQFSSLRNQANSTQNKDSGNTSYFQSQKTQPTEKVRGLSEDKFKEMIKQYDSNDKYTVIHQKRIGMSICSNGSRHSNNQEQIQAYYSISPEKSEERVEEVLKAQGIKAEDKNKIESQEFEYNSQTNQIDKDDKIKRGQKRIHKSEIKELSAHYDTMIKSLSPLSPPNMNKIMNTSQNNQQSTKNSNITPSNELENDNKSNEPQVEDFIINQIKKDMNASQVKRQRKNSEIASKDEDIRESIEQKNQQIKELQLVNMERCEIIDKLKRELKDCQESHKLLKQQFVNLENKQKQQIKTFESMNSKTIEREKQDKEKELKNHQEFERAEQAQKLDKYEKQIEQLISTLQKSDDEREGMIQEIQKISSQLQIFSTTCSQLKEQDNQKKLQIKEKQDKMNQLADQNEKLKNELKNIQQILLKKDQEEKIKLKEEQRQSEENKKQLSEQQRKQEEEKAQIKKLLRELEEKSMKFEEDKKNYEQSKRKGEDNQQKITKKTGKEIEIQYFHDIGLQEIQNKSNTPTQADNSQHLRIHQIDTSSFSPSLASAFQNQSQNQVSNFKFSPAAQQLSHIPANFNSPLSNYSDNFKVQQQKIFSFPPQVESPQKNVPQFNSNGGNNFFSGSQQRDKSSYYIQQFSPIKDYSKEQISMELRIAEGESQLLQKQVRQLKSRAENCSGEIEMSELLNDLQKILALKQKKVDQIEELKKAYQFC